MHVDKTTYIRYSSLGYYHVIWNEKTSVQAEKVSCDWLSWVFARVLIDSFELLHLLTTRQDRAVFTWLSKGIGFGFGFGFTTPFGWLVYLLWFWFYDSQVKTALIALHDDNCMIKLVLLTIPPSPLGCYA